MSVYVVQNQKRKNDRGILVPKFDLTPAKEFGRISFLLDDSIKPFNSEPVIRMLHERLKDYSDKDFILLIGNPCFIGFAVGIAALYNEGKVNVLQWSGISKKYTVIRSVLW